MTITQRMKESPQSKLTELQLKLLSFYREYYKEHRRYPRLIEAVKYFQTKHQYISQRAHALVEKGYMNKAYNGMFELTKKTWG